MLCPPAAAISSPRLLALALWYPKNQSARFECVEIFVLGMGDNVPRALFAERAFSSFDFDQDGDELIECPDRKYFDVWNQSRFLGVFFGTKAWGSLFRASYQRRVPVLGGSSHRVIAHPKIISSWIKDDIFGGEQVAEGDSHQILDPLFQVGGCEWYHYFLVFLFGWGETSVLIAAEIRSLASPLLCRVDRQW